MHLENEGFIKMVFEGKNLLKFICESILKKNKQLLLTIKKHYD